MNYRVDVMIVGDSATGHALLDKLASSKPSLNLAFISQAFKSTTTHAYVNVKYFRREVGFVSFRNRLFCCYLTNGDHIYATHVIIASGLSYAPLVIDGEEVPCVFNNIDDIPSTAKSQPALVIGDQDADFKLALEIAKKYKQVYLCTKEITITDKTTATTAKKLDKTENLAILPNTVVRKAISENGILQKVELDNYSTVNCSAIFVKTPAKPAVEFVPRKLIQKDEAGYLVVSENCESMVVPKCFAAGNCIRKYTKGMEQKLIETILNDF